MSTKIYDAYEFKGSLDELMSYLNLLRKRTVKASVPLLAASLNPYEFETYDYQDALKKALSSSMHYYEDPKLGGIMNVSASAVVYSNKSRLFVQFFGLPRNVKLRSSKLVDYHYQNQTDPWYDHEQYEATKRGKPKSKAWMKAQAKNYRERRRVWDAIMEDDGRPVHCGLVYEFMAPADSMEIAMEVFARLHKHSLGTGSESCQYCIKRKSEAEKKEVVNEAKP